MKDPAITVRAPRGTSDQIIRRARYWANHFDRRKRGAFDNKEVAMRGAAAFVVPALQDPPGFVIRHYGESILVEVSASFEILESSKQFETSETKRLKHGAVSNYFIFDGARVSHLDPTTNPPYQNKASAQVTLPLDRHSKLPKDFPTKLSASRFASRYSHFTKVKASLYSGWMRAAVQAAMGIGYGTEEVEEQRDYSRIGYQFVWPATDGVVFALPKVPLTASDLEYLQPMKPVSVRLTNQFAYVGPMLHWDDAVEDVIPDGDSPWTMNERWIEYLKLGAEGSDLGDPQSENLIRQFWGIPYSTPSFDLPTLIEDPKGDPDLEEALKQRVASGMISKHTFPESLEGWRPMIDEHGWAFPYNFAGASHVVIRRDAQGWPESRLVTLQFKDLTEEPLPTRTEIPTTGLVQYLQAWVIRRELDAEATAFKLRVSDDSKIKEWSSGVVGDPDFSDQSVMEDFKSHEVSWVRYPMSLQFNTSMQGYIDVQARGSDLIPEVHIKVPDYVGGGVVTWYLTPPFKPGTTEYRTDVPGQGLAPLSVFFTESSEMIVSRMFSSTGAKGREEVRGEEPDCKIESFTRHTTVYPGSERYRAAGLNVNESYNNDPDPVTSTLKRTAQFTHQFIVAQDVITDLARAVGYLFKVYLRKFEIHSGKKQTLKQASLVFPEWDRECVYIGYPKYGLGGYTKTTSYDAVDLESPHRVGTERCFPSGSGRTPEYFACTEHQRCPITLGEWAKAGPYPRIVTSLFDPVQTDCSHAFPGGPWAKHCDNLDELVAANPGGQDVYVPPTTQTNEPGSYTVEVHAYHSALRAGENELIRDHGEDVSISGWWFAVSPSLQGDRPHMPVSANCLGGRFVLLTKDLGVPDVKRIGSVAALPGFSDSNPGAAFIGVAING